MTPADVIGALVDAIATGLPYAVGYLGIWVVFRVMRDFDLTVDGSFVTGASIAALWITSGLDPWLALLLAFAGGGAAGLITFALHRWLRLPLILASIVVGVGLFSVNLKILGSPNVNLIGQSTITTTFTGAFGATPYDRGFTILLFSLVFLLVGGLLVLFLSSQAGLALRATGINAQMARAQGVDTARAMALALLIGNGLVGLSGGLVAQSQGYSDVNMGVGSILFGVTSILLGEVLLRRQTPLWGVLAVLLGTIGYRFLLALALRVGIDPDLYQGLTALIVVAAVGISLIGRTSRSRLLGMLPGQRRTLDTKAGSRA